jgi:hypothetical protein
MQILPYSKQDAAEWDRVIAHCPMATFLHTRRFLSYHGDRFRDASVILRDEEGRIAGLLPAAVDPRDDRRVVSHPGITFGGLLHAGNLFGERMIEAFEALMSYYRGQGITSLHYKAVPYIYHQSPSGDDLYTLFRIGARRFRCDLSCAIDLANRREPSSRRKRGLKKAISRGVKVVAGAQYVDDLWAVLEETLERKLGEKPVHSLDEIKNLQRLFPENIRFTVGLLDGEIVAGITLFSSRSVTRAQYIASNERGNDVSALDAVLEHAIEQARAEGRRYFDFGTSNRNDGQHLSASVYQFKTEFGAGGVAHEFYDIDLSSQD